MCAAKRHVKKCTGDPVVGLSQVSLNSSLPPHRGQALSLMSSGFTATPKVGRTYAVSVNQFKRKMQFALALSAKHKSLAVNDKSKVV
jgi:hypothetical protein